MTNPNTDDGNHFPPGERSLFLRALDWMFRYESMSGAGLCPVYLERWTLGLAFGGGAYLHHFIGDDWAIDPHDHPRRFVSIGLHGWYFEDTFNADGTEKASTLYVAPWVRSFPPEHLHRIRAKESSNTWTLVIVLRKARPWGFVRDGQWISFRDYVFGGKARPGC